MTRTVSLHQSPLHHSPLHARHTALGAKFSEFGGWEMPLAYPAGTLAEHHACRTAAAMFDVSHLGTVRVSGDGAFALLQHTFTNDLGRIGPGRAQYTHLCDPTDGSCVDDIIVWWRPGDTGEVFDVMPNASNTGGVLGALAAERAALGDAPVEMRDVTFDRAVIAVQGPGARAVVARVVPAAAELARFHVMAALTSRGREVVAAATGYTGEDGVELAVPAEDAPVVWDDLADAGAVPAGLGARDTLRLEAGLPLHGHELGRGITPYQAGLAWVVRPEKGQFRGADALAAELAGGVRRRLRGLVLDGRQPARADAAVFDPEADAATGAPLGVVTSGNFSPTLQRAIALAFLDPAVAVGARVEVDVRGRRLPAVVAALPFVRRDDPR